MSAPTPQDPSNVDVLMAITRLDTKVDAFTAQAADHEARLRVLEGQRWPARSVTILVSLVALGISASSLVAYQ